MSSSPRSNATRTAIFALSVGAAIIVISLLLLAFGVDVLKIGDTFVTGLFPPIAVTSQGAQIRELYTVIFLIAVAIFIVVEGLIIWYGHPLSTQARRRHAPAADARQQRRRVRLDGRPDADRHLHVHRVVADAQRGRHQRVRRQHDEDPRRRRPVPVAVRLPRPERQDRLHRVHPARQRGRRDDGPGGPDRPALARQQGRHPRLLRPAVPVQARRRARVGRTSSTSPSMRPMPGRPSAASAPSCAGSATASCCSRSRLSRPQDFDTWLAGKAASTPPSASPAPVAHPHRAAAQRHRAAALPHRAAAGPARPSSSRRAASSTSRRRSPRRPTTPFQIEFDNQDAGVPHNVTIHKDSPTGEQVFAGDIFPGVAKKTYDVPALPAGTYSYRLCRSSDDDDRHPDGPVRSARWRRPR